MVDKRRARGPSLVEIALLGAFIALACIIGLQNLINTTYSSISSSLGGANTRLDQELRNAVSELPMGNLAYSDHLRMVQGTPMDIIVSIGFKNDERLRARLAPGTLTVEQIPIGATMSAELVGDDHQFEVTPLTPAEQSGVGAVTTWTWRVTPLSSGHLALTLRVSALIRLSNGDHTSRQMLLKKAQIDVEASPGYILARFWNDHWEWMLGSPLLLAILGWLWTRMRPQKKKRAAGYRAD